MLRRFPILVSSPEPLQCSTSFAWSHCAGKGPANYEGMMGRSRGKRVHNIVTLRQHYMMINHLDTTAPSGGYRREKEGLLHSHQPQKASSLNSSRFPWYLQFLVLGEHLHKHHHEVAPCLCIHPQFKLCDCKATGSWRNSRNHQRNQNL